MIRHIVMYTIKNETINGRSKEENLQLAKQLGDALGTAADTLTSFTCGLNAPELGKADSADIVLNCQFADQAALESYRKHPAHVAFGKHIHPCMENRSTIDYFESAGDT